MQILPVFLYFCTMKYAEVILPLPLENTYFYSIPEEMIPYIKAKVRVTVPFGQKRYYTAIVKDIHECAPDPLYAYKEVFAVLDKSPVIHPRQMQFWEWMASYYLCKIGDVYKAAVPTGLLSNESDKKFVPRKESFIRLSEVCRNEEVLNAVLKSLKRAKQQEQLLLYFVDLAKPFQSEWSREVSKKELLRESKIHTSVLDGLIKRGILESYEREISRIQQYTGDCQAPNTLTEAQQTALTGIQSAFRTKAVCLLHGVSLCGKTEIYIHLISDTLRQGSHVLYLLPEIAVTARMTERLVSVFGDRLLVYHSGFSDNERVEVWNRLLNAKEPFVVLGVRSSLFLPFANLGLVIVDQEHDYSYRQQDRAPRYHARNATIMLAYMYGAKTLLGSLAPSLESYYHAGSGKYGLVTLTTRYGETREPLTRLADVKELKRKKIMKDTLFSPILKEKMEDALKRDEQIILFQNRRGFAAMMECKSCGYVVRCVNCDVSLSYHKHSSRLVCHYCGYSVSLHSRCPACGGNDIKLAGFGTEKVEEEIETLFPGIKMNRLDYDTARTRGAYKHILAGFEQGKTKVLIGTQMLAKGLECAQVGVAGILNADSLMNVPDFRAHERAFQLMMQVIALTGRNNKQGIAVIQTSQPEHSLIQAVQAFDYQRMAIDQLNERKTFRYPPYFRLIVLVLRGPNEQMLEQIATHYAETLFEELGKRVLPPFTPPVNRVQTLYLRHIMLKLETSLPIVRVRNILDKVNRHMQIVPGFSKIVLHYEVDN